MLILVMLITGITFAQEETDAIEFDFRCPDTSTSVEANIITQDDHLLVSSQFISEVEGRSEYTFSSSAISITNSVASHRYIITHKTDDANYFVMLINSDIIIENTTGISIPDPSDDVDTLGEILVYVSQVGTLLRQ